MPCPCGIDVHTHVVPERFPAYAAGPAPADWPSMADAEPCHKHVVIRGATYRTVSDRCWSPARRIADMDAQGVASQVLSPMPELLSYWMEPLPARDLLRFVNGEIAAMVAAGSGRLMGFGAVPLQDVDLACRELERLMADGAFVGVEIGSNVNGRPIGAPEFAPFFAEAERLGAAIFVHAVKPAGTERLVGPKPLEQALGYPTDVGLAVGSVLTTGLILRHPSLRIAFSHGGGTLASLLPRLRRAWQVFPAVGGAMAVDPLEQARRLFYDMLVFDAPTLRHLAAVVGDTQLLIGTDYPFNFAERDPHAAIDDAFADAAVRRRVRDGNARRFLGLEAAP